MGLPGSIRGLWLLLLVCVFWSASAAFGMLPSKLDRTKLIQECDAAGTKLRQEISADGQYVIDQGIEDSNQDGTDRSRYRQRYTIWIRGDSRRLDRETYGLYDDHPLKAEKSKGMIGKVCTVSEGGRLFLVGLPDGATQYELKELKRGVPVVLHSTIAELLESPYVFQNVDVASFLKDPALTFDSIEPYQDGGRELIRVTYHRTVKGRQPGSETPETGILAFDPARHWAIVHAEWERPKYQIHSTTDITYSGDTSQQKSLKNRYENGTYKRLSLLERNFESFRPGAPDPREFTLAAFGLQEATATEPIGDVVQRDRNVWLYGTILAAVLALIAALVLRSRARRSAS